MHKKILLTVIAIMFLGITYYGVSSLFKKTIRHDAVPEKIEIKVNSIGTATLSSKKETNAQINTDTESDKSSQVLGTAGHPASGVVKVIVGENSKIIRYENFKTINGPDLYVYLSKDLQAKDFVSLGKLKATEGNINYEIPKNVNLADYSYVIIWCKTFGVLFNSALINQLIK